MIDTTSRGVSLHVDHSAEDFYLDVAIDHYPIAYSDALVKIDDLGLVMMGEGECPSEFSADGATRFFLCKKVPA
jgi:hypothetical protein